MEVLRADDATKRFGTVVALTGVSITVRRGECLAVVGESGSGKTTLLRCFNGLIAPDQGRILVDEQDVTELDRVALRRRIGYVPQDGGLLPHWRVQRNVELVPRLRRMKDRRERAQRALWAVGLDPETFGKRWPRDLSGGQRQRVAIARALAAQPDVVLLDEPFGALDAITRADLQRSFAALQSDLGITAVLVTHDLREALWLGTRVAVMRAGRIEQEARPDALLDAPATPYVAELLRRAGVAREPQ